MIQTMILACDIGTSSVKTSLIRPNGTVLDSACHAYPTHVPRAGWAEQDPGDWWEGVCANARLLAEKHPDAASHVAVIGVSGHMLGCLPVDLQGKALRPAMIHADTRASGQAAFIAQSVGAAQMYGITGNILDVRSSLCKVLWVRDNEPQVYKAAERFLQAKDYIVSKMTGNIDTTDLSDASHAQMIDIRTMDYDAAVLSELGLDRQKLPALHRSTDIVGRLTPDSARSMGLRAGIPVCAGGGDGACASVGAGVASAGDIYCCLGTTAWIARASALPVLDRKSRLFNILSLDGQTSGVFGTIQCAGRSVQWAMDLFSQQDPAAFDRMAASVPPGSGGLIFLPYLEGERSPLFDTDARGVFFGVNPGHGKASFMRAVLEGVALALRDVLEVFRETQAAGSMRIIGAAAASGVWRGIIADACNLSLDTLSVPGGDATSLGAAVAAGVGAGLYRNIGEGARLVTTASRTDPDSAQAALYSRMYGIYQSLYPQLKPSYQALARLRADWNDSGKEV